jgi:oxygen-dependent protoporphyrinogen oxidase
MTSKEKPALRAAVYGSGVSGLLASYALVKRGVDVDVIDPYEESILQSLETDDGVVELAANSILSSPELEEILSDIELQAIPYTKLGRNKYVYAEKKAKKWPLSFWSTLKSFSALCALALKKDSVRPLAYETIQVWGERVLTNDLLENLIKPGLQGVYGYETGSVSASLAIKNLFKKKKKSKFKGSVSFTKGMGQFTLQLKNYLKKNRVEFLSAAVRKDYDLSIVSTPAHSLPDLVSEKNKALLAEIDYKEVSIGTFIIEQKEKLDIEGFGCVFKDQDEGALGLILNSDLFPKRSKYGYVSETWIFDGRKVKTQYEMEKAVLKIRKVGFGKLTPTKTVYFKHWSKAFPNYSLTLEKTLETLEQKNDKVYFFANWTGDLGIGSMAKSVGPYVDKILKEIEPENKLESKS